MTDLKNLSKKHRKDIEGKIVGKRLKAIRWRNQPDFDNEILALEFEDKATLQLFATVHRQRIWGHIEDA